MSINLNTVKQKEEKKRNQYKNDINSTLISILIELIIINQMLFYMFWCQCMFQKKSQGIIKVENENHWAVKDKKSTNIKRSDQFQPLRLPLTLNLPSPCSNNINHIDKKIRNSVYFLVNHSTEYTYVMIFACIETMKKLCFFGPNSSTGFILFSTIFAQATLPISWKCHVLLPHGG